MAEETGRLTARRRKLFVLADKIGLTREERIEISEAMLWRDIVSWKELDDDQVSRMLDALEGYVLVSYLLMNRAAQPSGGGIKIRPSPDRT